MGKKHKEGFSLIKLLHLERLAEKDRISREHIEIMARRKDAKKESASCCYLFL